MRKIKKWIDRIPDGLYLVLTVTIFIIVAASAVVPAILFWVTGDIRWACANLVVFIIVVAVLMYLAFHDDSIYEKDDVEEQIKKTD